MLHELWAELQRERKGGPSANFAFDTDRSVMSGRDLFDNWKSKTGSPRISSCTAISSVKSIKKMWEMFRINTVAIVFNRYGDDIPSST